MRLHVEHLKWAEWKCSWMPVVVSLFCLMWNFIFPLIWWMNWTGINAARTIITSTLCTLHRSRFTPCCKSEQVPETWDRHGYKRRTQWNCTTCLCICAWNTLNKITAATKILKLDVKWKSAGKSKDWSGMNRIKLKCHVSNCCTFSLGTKQSSFDIYCLWMWQWLCSL